MNMKAAYDTLPKDRLLDIHGARLDRAHNDMIAAMLSPLTVRIVGDRKSSEAVLINGVPQGSRLSPVLFSIFIDVLAERLRQVPTTDTEWPGNLFADDVALFAKTEKGLQRLLDICSRWAADYGMTWSASKC